MPLVTSTYAPPFPLRNGHLQSITTSLFRRVAATPAERERLETPDGDFLDLDWRRTGSKNLAVILHGLEGSSESKYVLGMVNAFAAQQWDTLALNFRGCSGAPNLKLSFYHSGKTDDLELALNHALKSPHYDRLALVGFSVGGNILLKYLAEQGRRTPTQIQSAVALSVPCDLRNSAEVLARRTNTIYMRYLLQKLYSRMLEKSQRFPDQISVQGFSKIKTFRDFDTRYTAPLHGFSSTEEYWARASSLPLLAEIRTPTLLINALDDPFLGPDCFPTQAASASEFLSLETPRYGGHVGFISALLGFRVWTEPRTITFSTTGS